MWAVGWNKDISYLMLMMSRLGLGWGFTTAPTYTDRHFSSDSQIDMFKIDM
jgi:hypothetical protein